MENPNEEIIRRAQSEGRFADLPGKGKPLNLAKRNLKDPVAGIVEESGLVPEWVQIGKELTASQEESERRMEAWRRRRDPLRAETEARLQKRDLEGAGSLLKQLKGERDHLLGELARRWVKDRLLTERYNLLVMGHAQTQMLPSPEKQVERFMAAFPNLSLSSESPPRIVEKAETTDSKALVKTLTEELKPETAGSKRSIDGQRAEALLQFKSKYIRRW